MKSMPSEKCSRSIPLTTCAITFASAIQVSPITFAQDSLIEEVVVTARKREESLQNVPVAVSALSPSQIEQIGSLTVMDISRLVPNVELHQNTFSGQALSASIRGMAFDDLEKSYEPTVGVSVDGVFMASNSGAVVDLFDLEAVEVLRGPQGTLYGRNTIAGVINIKRTQPTGELGLKLEGTFATHDRQDLKGILNLPIGENGGLKLHYRDLQQDSHLFNTFRNERPENRDSNTWGASFRYDFSDNFTATLSYDDYEHWTQPPDPVATGVSPDTTFCLLGAIINTAGSCNENSAALSQANGYETSNASEQIYSYMWGENLTLNAQYTGDNFTLKYIFGVMDFDEDAKFDSWGAPQPLYQVRRQQNYEQTSHEIQYLSDWDGPINVVAGLYYLETESYMTSGPDLSSRPVGVLARNFESAQDAEARAVFGEIIWEIDGNWTATAGARWTNEKKDLFTRSFGSLSDRLAGGPSFGLLTPNYDDDNVTYRFVLQREMSFGMAYGSYSTGYRAGGFNSRGNNVQTVGPFESEEVTSIELGIRSQPTDNLQLNVTGFSADYSDKQQFVVTDGTQCGLAATATCTFVRNIAETKNQGLEVEAILVASDNLTFRASYGYLDAEFESYNFNGRDISSTAPLIYAPENTWSLNALHISSVMGGNLALSATWSYRDEVWGAAEYGFYNFDTGPKMNIESHDQLDLSATFLRDLGNGQLKLVVYGTDVLEADGRVSRTFDAGAFAWHELVPGRQLGLTVGYEF